MAEGNSNSTVIVVLLVVLMMVGVLMMFMMSLVMEDDDDPREETREYTAYGTVDGVEYEGTATCSYANESSLCYTYYFTITLYADDGTELDMDFGAIFDLDDSPSSDLYDYVGEAEYGGETVTVWTMSSSFEAHVIYVSEYCTIVYAEIVSGTESVYLEIVSD